MKKFKSIISYLVCIVCLAFVLSGCGELKVKSAIIKSNTLENTIVLNDTLDTSKAEAIVTWSDDSITTAMADDMEFGSIDTSTTGEKTLTITYKKFVFTYKINVVATEADVNTIMGFESRLINSFNSNSSEKESEKEEFADLEQPLFVGDDNKFNFDLNVSGITSTGDRVDNLTMVRTDISVEMKKDEEFVLLDSEIIDEYVAVDNVNNTFDFTEKAIGKEFKISMVPVNIAEGYTGITGINQEISVIDGFNVYHAYELSLYDNDHSAYNDFREAKGIDEYFGKVNAFVFQKDIKVLKEDVLTEFFWAEGDENFDLAQTYTDQELAGTIKDRTGSGIYKRQMESNEKFDFIGNYFALDLSAFPRSVVECDNVQSIPTSGINVAKGKMMTAHYALFYTHSGSPSVEQTTASAEWKNLNYIGNSTYSNDVLQSGGLILSKMYSINFTGKNTIMNDFYIGYMSEAHGDYYYEQCKGYNSFQTFMYVYGASHVLLNDCEFIDCGGPAIISECASGGNQGDGNFWQLPSNIDIVNTTLTSIISGKEPYFKTYKGADTAIAQIIAADQSLYGQATLQGVKAQLAASLVGTGYEGSDPSVIFGYDFDKSVSIVKDQKQTGDVVTDYMNFMVFMNGSGMSFTTGADIKGYTRMFETMDEYYTYYGINGFEQDKTVTYGLDYYDTFLKAESLGKVPYFESASTGGYMSAAGQNNLANKQCYWSADYINVYTQLGLGAVLEAVQVEY